MTIYPVGVRRVTRKWKEQKSKQGEAGLIPDDRKATLPELIETPITIQKSKTNAARTPEIKTVGEEEPVSSAEMERVKAI